MIYIYDDHHHNNLHVMRAIQAVTDAPVDFCDARMIIENKCLDKAQLLIMPGGADLFYCEKLNGLGNQIIRKFVTDGGAYLGICAGAYYGCASLDWNNGEIDGPRELALSNAHAVGPVDEWVENKYSIYKGSWKKPVTLCLFDNTHLSTLYDGGAVFENIGNVTNVIARYEDLDGHPPAIIEGRFGDGRYILSSPHIEKFGHLLSDGLYKLLNNSYERELEVVDNLLIHEDKQKTFFKTIINKLVR